MSFAALESRLNASVLKHLANAQATIGAATVSGVFSNAYAASDGGVGMAGSQPMFTLATTDVPADPVGTQITVSGVAYTIAAHEPDGAGMSVLFLERTT